MTRRIGRVGLFLLVALTVCALTAASAAATAHFEPAVVNFTTASGTSTIYASSLPAIKCSSDKGSGGVTSKEGLSWVSLIFEGCKSSMHCLSSLGFEALSGEDGRVAAAEATSEFGVMLKINSTIECGGETLKLRGTVAGEFTPLTLAFTHNLNFAVVSGVQKIKTITIGSNVVKPKLEYSLNGSPFVVAALESEESNSFVKEIKGAF
jgi:hypothetical protein